MPKTTLRPKPDADGSSFRLEDFLPYRLSVTTTRVSRAFARSYSERFGLTVPEWRVLAVLGGFAPLSSNQLCALTEMDKVRVCRTIAALRERDLISRKTDPADQRCNELTLTRKGRRLYDDIVPLARAMEDDLKAALTAEELKVLTSALNKLDARVLAEGGDRQLPGGAAA